MITIEMNCMYDNKVQILSPHTLLCNFPKQMKREDRKKSITFPLSRRKRSTKQNLSCYRKMMLQPFTFNRLSSQLYTFISQCEFHLHSLFEIPIRLKQVVVYQNFAQCLKTNIFPLRKEKSIYVSKINSKYVEAS